MLMNWQTSNEWPVNYLDIVLGRYIDMWSLIISTMNLCRIQLTTKLNYSSPLFVLQIPEAA